MSGKVLKPLIIGASIIAIGVATGGIGFAAAGSANGFLAGALGAGLSVGVGTITTTALGGALLAAGLGTALSGVAAGLQKTPKATLGQLDRLNATINPLAPRVMVLGRQVAMGTDIRYVEPSGADQEYIDYIIAVAAHRVASIDKLYIDAKLAWTAVGGPQGEFAGYLSVTPILEGNAANAIVINDGSKWGASRRLTGCAYIHIRIKRTGIKKAESPFSGGLSNRLTIIGDGMPMYDPRFDSTAGGSGPMRVGDQATWAVEYAGVSIADNLPLQQLARLIGWKINGKLSVGDGFPPARVELSDFIIAANLADEAIALVAGGTQRRYTGELVANENDNPSQVRALLMAGCNGQLRIRAGKIGLWLAHNDLAEAAADDGLNDDDVLSGFTFSPGKLEETPNVVRGQFTDPSEASLYQMKDYPEVRLASRDGIDRVLPINLAVAKNAPQAQRTVKQALQRKQYGWTFSATFGERAAKYRPGSLVPLTFSATSFVRKLFRVEMIKPSFAGRYDMILLEERSALYAWDQDERAAVQAAPAVRFDPLNSPLIQGISQAGETADWSKVVDDDGNRPEDGATVGMTDAEAAALAALDADTAAALLAIAAAEARIDEIEGTISVPIDELEARILAAEGEITSLSSGLATANSTISTVSTAVSNVEGDLADVTVRIGAAETTIETQQLAIDTIDTQVATVTTDLATAGSNISLALTAIYVLEGSQATMASSIASQGSTIASLSSTTTTLAGTVATLSTSLSAGRPNLLPNGDFSNGTVGWTPYGAGFGYAVYSGSVGNFLDIYNPTGSMVFFAQDIPYPGSDNYTLSFESVESNGGPGAYIVFQALNAAKDTEIVPSVAVNVNIPNTWDVRKSLTLPPAGAGAAYLRVIAVLPPGAGTSASRFMIQRGVTATIWRDEASVKLTQAALSALGSQYASLSATVSVQGVNVSTNASAIATANGNITSLFARYGVELDVNGYGSGFILNNNGSRSDAVWAVDRFRIASPGSPELQPFEVVSGVLFARAAVIRDLSVETIKISGNAITKRSFAAMLGGANAGTNSWLTVCTRVVTLPYAADVILQASMQQSYSSSVKTWTARFNVNAGTIVQARGGAGAYTDVPSINGMISLPAGTHTIDLEWFGIDSTISLTAANLIVDPAMK